MADWVYLIESIRGHKGPNASWGLFFFILPKPLFSTPLAAMLFGGNI